MSLASNGTLPALKIADLQVQTQVKQSDVLIQHVSFHEFLSSASLPQEPQIVHNQESGLKRFYCPTRLLLTYIFATWIVYYAKITW